MKKNLLSTVVTAFALTALNATAASFGTPTLDWTLTQQVTSNVFSATTNRTGLTITITDKFKSTVTNFHIGNGRFLQIVSNSFNTTFPKGAKLATDGSNLYVVDKTGTNIILNISDVVTLVTEDFVLKDVQTTTTKIKPASTNTASGNSFTQIGYVSFIYDDSTMATGDGTTTDFTFSGLATYVYDQELGASRASVSISLTNGAGAGMIRGTNSIMSGSFTGKATVPVVD